MVPGPGAIKFSQFILNLKKNIHFYTDKVTCVSVNIYFILFFFMIKVGQGVRACLVKYMTIMSPNKTW